MGAAWSFSISPQQLGMPLARECGWVCRRHASPLVWHTNDGFELTFALKGSVVWQVNGGPDLCVRGNEFSITQPRVLHRGQYNVISPVDLFYVVINPSVTAAEANTGFSRADVKELSRRFYRQGNRVVRASTDLLDHLRTLRATWLQLSHNPRAMLKAVARAQICQVLIYAAKSLDSSAPPPAATAIQGALLRMQNDPARIVSMDGIAAEVGLSRSRFYEQFRTITGMTPSDYFQRLRCMNAAEALAATRMDVTRVALNHGFSSSQYFSKCFKKYIGTTPSSYRALCRSSATRRHQSDKG